MLTKWEAAIVFVVIVGLGVILGTIGRAEGWTSDTMASWVQAVGTTGAVLLVTLPVFVQHRLQRRRSRQVVLASAEMAYGVMSEIAERYMNPNYVGSEWWVPQWDILQKTLADCPIHQTGSVEALQAFVEFQQLFARASAFDEPPAAESDGTLLLGSFVVVLMTNAGTQMERLRGALKT